MDQQDLIKHLEALIGQEVVITSRLPEPWGVASGAMLVTKVLVEQDRVYVLSDEGWALWVSAEDLKIEPFEDQ